MVDFNNDATITTPATDVEKILILQKRENFIDALEHCNKIDGMGGTADLSVARSRLHSLYLQLQASLKRNMDPQTFLELEKDLKSEELQDILNAFFSISNWLDEIKLTRIDTKRKYDSSKVETENKARGL